MLALDDVDPGDRRHAKVPRQRAEKNQQEPDSELPCELLPRSLRSIYASPTIFLHCFLINAMSLTQDLLDPLKLGTPNEFTPDVVPYIRSMLVYGKVPDGARPNGAFFLNYMKDVIVGLVKRVTCRTSPSNIPSMASDFMCHWQKADQYLCFVKCDRV